MNEEAQLELDRLLKLSPSDLTADDRAFLRARRSYLTDDQKRIFKSVLDEKLPEIKEAVGEPAKTVEPPLYVSKKDQQKK